jgi:hypothetical protein
MKAQILKIYRSPEPQPILRRLFPLSDEAYEVLVLILAGCVACCGFPVLLVERCREAFSCWRSSRKLRRARNKGTFAR